MDSLKICSALKTCFCPNTKPVNCNDFHYGQKGAESSAVHVSAQRPTHGALPHAPGLGHLTSSRHFS